MGDNKNIENMTIKQAVEEHEKKMEKKKQHDMKKKIATAAKNMETPPSELEKSDYILQEEIAKQVQAVMMDGESMTDNQPTMAVPDAARQGTAGKNTQGRNAAEKQARRKAERHGASGQRAMLQSAAGKNTLQSEKENKTVSQDTRNMASDARQIREQIARKKEMSRASYGNIEVRSEVDDWLERKKKMLEKRQVGKTPKQNSVESMPEEIEDNGKLRFIWNFGEIGKWFQSLCWLHIPIFGMIYIIVIALRKKTPTQKRNFAIAWIMYKVLVWILALTILYILYKVGLNFVDGMMSYIK